MITEKLKRITENIVVVLCILVVFIGGGAVTVIASDNIDIAEGRAELALSDEYLTLGKSVDGILTSSQSSYEYEFSITNAGRVSIKFTAYQMPYTIRLYDDDGDCIASENMEYNYDLEFGKTNFHWDLSKGTYYIVVYGRKNIYDGETANYKIVTSYKSVGTSEGEPNNSFEEATLVKIPSTITGMLALNDKKDIYKFYLQKSTEVEIIFKVIDADTCGLSIYDEEGDREAYEWQSREDNKKIYRYMLSAGVHYIVIVPPMVPAADWSGSYMFTISSGIAMTSKNVRLSTEKCMYNGKVRNPSVIVKDNSGNRLVKGRDYTIYIPLERKSIGTYTYKIVFKGAYKGTIKKNFTIVPAKTKITSIKNKRAGIRITWKKSSSANATGYLVYRSINGGGYKLVKTIKSNRITYYSDSKANRLWSNYSYKVVVYKKVGRKTYKAVGSSAKRIYRYN